MVVTISVLDVVAGGVEVAADAAFAAAAACASLSSEQLQAGCGVELIPMLLDTWKGAIVLVPSLVFELKLKLGLVVMLEFALVLVPEGPAGK